MSIVHDADNNEGCNEDGVEQNVQLAFQSVHLLENPLIELLNLFLLVSEIQK
jgi:hypothetical protein